MVGAHPLVSVIMPAYNAEPSLPAAIESVLEQELADFELIIVDDASTDATPQIAGYYRARDPRVRTVRNTTNSRSATIQWEPRNDGLKIARGTLIAYLDSDNRWNRRMLRVMADTLICHPDIQLTYCRSRNLHAPGDIDAVIARDRRVAVASGPDWVVFAQECLDPAELGRTQYVDTNEMVHRASVFTGLGSLWHTYHPRREWVNSHQGKQRAYRRHNDLDLVERIIRMYGVASILQVRDVLVDFSYRSASEQTGTMWSARRSRIRDGVPR
jgi:glycosyltransferase involved in cell wall biosynthesis